MAVVVPQRIFSEGTTNRLCVYRVFGMTQADTVQLSADFGNVRAAFFYGASVAVDAAGTVSANTVVTNPAAWNKDDGLLVVYGAGVQQ